MICAHLANIRVFATGGIGGVHREAGETFDISADLEELSLTPVAVVAAGAKAILDIPKTLEVLETKGVPVIGFGTDEFPAFWSRRSGLAAPLRLDDPADVAQTFLTRRELGLEGGMLVANPVSEADEIPFEEMSPHIDQALAEATSQNVSGKDVTPFVLGRIFNLTEGRSLETNVALVKNNARLAARIALALREISRLS
jgi:pseudouridine-5'-phosphate glycosidase